MSDRYREYARAVAEATRKLLHDKYVCNVALLGDADLDAILASIKPPAPTQAESYDAPTCDGWWWAHDFAGWRVVEIDFQFNGFDYEAFDAWVGPLQPPGTTTPDVRAQVDAPQAEVDRWRGTAANQMIQEAVAAERDAIGKHALELAEGAIASGYYRQAINDVLEFIRARSAQEKGESDGES